MFASALMLTFTLTLAPRKTADAAFTEYLIRNTGLRPNLTLVVVILIHVFGRFLPVAAYQRNIKGVPLHPRI